MGFLVCTGQKEQESGNLFLAVGFLLHKIRLLHRFVIILDKCLIKRKK
jgi:hypothetical protein